MAACRPLQVRSMRNLGPADRLVARARGSLRAAGADCDPSTLSVTPRNREGVAGARQCLALLRRYEPDSVRVGLLDAIDIGWFHDDDPAALRLLLRIKERTSPSHEHAPLVDLNLATELGALGRYSEGLALAARLAGSTVTGSGLHTEAVAKVGNFAIRCGNICAFAWAAYRLRAFYCRYGDPRAAFFLSVRVPSLARRYRVSPRWMEVIRSASLLPP
jgi:hypothetical protein